MPASRSSTGYPGRRPEPNDEIRPPGEAIMAVLTEEGIAWQGQVAIIGQEEVPARLIVTSERFLLMRGSDTLLELPRSWLVPAPLVIAGADVRVSITPEGTVPGRDATERIHLQLRDGRDAATRLVSILSGRGALFAETPGWRSDVGAGRANALPTLPAFETRQDIATGRPASGADPETRGVAPIATWNGGQSRRVTPPEMQASEPEPVEATSRAGRFLTYRPVEGDAAPAPAVVAVAPADIDEERERRRGGGWLVLGSCVAILALVLAAGWFGREYLPAPVTERLPAFVMDASDIGTETAITDGDDVAGNTIDANNEGTDGTGGAESDPADIMPTEVALGLGGQVPTEPETETEAESGNEQPADGESVPAPNSDVAPPAEAVDDTGGEDVADEGSDGGGQVPPGPSVPTEAPSSEPTVAPETATVEATEVAPDDVTATATETAEETATAETIETVPPRASETTEPTVAPTETVEPTPTLEPQAPSVDPNDPPAQAFAAEGFRYSIAGADSGSTLEDLPEIAEVGYGEWVVLTIDGQNWTDAEQVFDMAQFVLIADGEQVQMDVGTSWVASQLDLMPAYGNTDAILWAPGESHTFALTFLAPVGAQSLALQAGDQRFDLTPVLERDTGLVSQPQSPAPEAIEAPVVEVIDGETIVVDIDGVRQTVRYLGIDVPDTDECHGAESSEANRALVEGAVVRIERQATNVDAQGNWVRDVWVASDEGAWELAAHRLVRDGAATAAISEPNTRFASWLGGADAAAQAEGLGLWATCGDTAQDIGGLAVRREVGA